VNEGFIWTTPSEKNVPNGWLWTNRLDLISVIECREDGSDPKQVVDKEVLEDYFKRHNRRKKVMDRINDFNRYKADLMSDLAILHDHKNTKRKERLMLLDSDIKVKSPKSTDHNKE